MNVDLNTAMLLAVALINLGTLIYSKRTNSNMVQLEKNTNSKMDALLVATARASQAEGEARGLEQGRNEPRPTITENLP